MKYPWGLELWFNQELTRLMLHRLNKFLRNADKMLTDAERTDAEDEWSGLTPVTQKLYAQMAEKVNASMNANFSSHLVNKELYIANNYKGYKEWHAEIKTFLTDLEGTTHSRLTELIGKSIQEGLSLRDMKHKIHNTLIDQTRNRVSLIARTEVGKLNSKMTRSTFEAVGIERYKWRTSIDERVRDSHLLMEGKICNVNDRTVVWDKHLNRFVQRDGEMPLLHPGEDFQCRCIMEVLDDEVKDVEEELLEEHKVEVKNAVQEFKNKHPGGEGMKMPSVSPTNPQPVSDAPIPVELVTAGEQRAEKIISDIKGKFKSESDADKFVDAVFKKTLLDAGALKFLEVALKKVKEIQFISDGSSNFFGIWQRIQINENNKSQFTVAQAKHHEFAHAAFEELTQDRKKRVVFEKAVKLTRERIQKEFIFPTTNASDKLDVATVKREVGEIKERIEAWKKLRGHHLSSEDDYHSEFVYHVYANELKKRNPKMTPLKASKLDALIRMHANIKAHHLFYYGGGGTLPFGDELHSYFAQSYFTRSIDERALKMFNLIQDFYPEIRDAIKTMWNEFLPVAKEGGAP